MYIKFILLNFFGPLIVKPRIRWIRLYLGLGKVPQLAPIFVRMCTVPLSYASLIFLHFALLPFPIDTIMPSSRSDLRTRRMVSRLTAGQARSMSEMEKGRSIPAMVERIKSALLPFLVINVPTRDSNSLYALRSVPQK